MTGVQTCALPISLPRDIKEWAAVAPSNIQERIINAFLRLDEKVHKELRFHKGRINIL